MSKRNATTLSNGLAALYELTRQRISDGVRSAATLEMQQRHGAWLLRELGDVAVHQVDEQLLEQLVTPRVPPRRFGSSTLRKRLSTLRQVVALAHRRRWVRRMPAWPQVLAPWRPRQRFLRRYEDAVRIFEALLPHRASWFWLCLWTGQHASDVERMTWTDVELSEPPAMLIRNTKNRKTAIRVRMPIPLARHLRARFAAELPAPGARIVQPWASRKSTLPLTCYRRLGITPGVVAWAGHSSPAMMARAYAHALPVGLQEVADELDAFAEGAEPPRPPKRASGEPIASGGHSGAGPGKAAA